MATKKVERTIHADKKWQGTGVHVNPNDKIDVKYIGGSWTCNPAIGYNDANGNGQYQGKPGYSLPGANEGALIGQVGGKTFLVGSFCHIPNTSSGELLLIINDDLSGTYGSGFADNAGSIKVEIEYEFENMTTAQLNSAK